MRAAVLAVFSLLLPLAASAQSTLISSRSFDGTFGSSDSIRAAVAAPGGGYYLAGYSYGANDADIWILKVDAALNLISSITINGTANGFDTASGLVLSSTGNVYVVGATSVASVGMKPWIGRFSASLGLVDTTTYTGGQAPAGDFNSSFDAVTFEPSGDLLVVGDAYVNAGDPWSRVALFRYNSALILLSTGGYSSGFASEYGSSILRLASGDIIVGGGVAPAALTSHNAWIGRFNSSLQYQNSVTLTGAAGHTDQTRGLALGSNGDVYAAGIMINSGLTQDIWLARYTTALSFVSSRAVAGVADTHDLGNALSAGPSGTVILGGSLSQSGQDQNLLIAEVLESDLNFKSSATVSSAGSQADEGYALAVDTAAGTALLVGHIVGSAHDAWLGLYNVSGVAAASPTAPSGFAGVAQSSSSILWSWTDNSSDETGFRVKRGVANLSGDLAANTTTWLHTGLTANATSGFLLAQAFHSTGTADSGTAQRYTLSDPPNSISATFWGSSATFTWPTLSNPPGTVWAVERSTNGVGYSAIYLSSAAATYTDDTGMSLGTSYYYRIRSQNGDGVYSAHANAVATIFTGGPSSPTAPSGFAGTVLSSTSIRWTWTDNSSDETGFRVMSGGVNLSGDLAAGTTQWVQNGLSPSTGYGPYFARVFNSTGTSDSSTASATTDSVSCGTGSSLQSGAWSSTDTWSFGRAPTSCDQISVGAGHTVTVDGLTAAAHAGTVSGTLMFSRASSSTLTFYGGKLTVSGVLDMGTSGSPIPDGVQATLALSSGAFLGNTTLEVTTAGRFWVYGAAKAPGVTLGAGNDVAAGQNTVTLPATAASLNWKVGETVVVGPSQGRGTARAEARVISGIAGSVITLSSSVTYAHDSSAGIRVVNLDRNVVVGSVGNRASSTTAHVSVSGRSADGFVAAYGRFRDLGASLAQGFIVESLAHADVSSSVFSGGVRGLDAQGDRGRYYGNIFYGNTTGMQIGGKNIDLYGNDFVANFFYGLYQSGQGNYLFASRNESYANNGPGIWFNGQAYDMQFLHNRSYSNGGASSQHGLTIDNSSRRNVLAFNTIRDNGDKGIHVDGSHNLVFGNEISDSGGRGIVLVDRGVNTFVDNVVHGNAEQGFRVYSNSDGSQIVGGKLGYTAAGVSRPNGTDGEFVVTSTGVGGYVLRGVDVNPAGGGVDVDGYFGVPGLTLPGQYVASFNQNADTGTLRVWGDMTISTLTLTTSAASYGARLTTPLISRGSTTVASVSAPVDANAVTQLVEARYSSLSGLWRVYGSVTGDMGTLPGAGGSAAFPAGTPQFTLTLSASEPVDGDAVHWAVIGQAADAGARKSVTPVRLKLEAQLRVSAFKIREAAFV